MKVSCVGVNGDFRNKSSFPLQKIGDSFGINTDLRIDPKSILHTGYKTRVKSNNQDHYIVIITTVNTLLTTALRILVYYRLIDLFAVKCKVQLRIQEAKVQDVFATWKLYKSRKKEKKDN